MAIKNKEWYNYFERNLYITIISHEGGRGHNPTIMVYNVIMKIFYKYHTHLLSYRYN